MNVGHLLSVRLETAAALAIGDARTASAVRAAIRAELRDIAGDVRIGDWIELPGGTTCRVEFEGGRR